MFGSVEKRTVSESMSARSRGLTPPPWPSARASASLARVARRSRHECRHGEGQDQEGQQAAARDRVVTPAYRTQAITRLPHAPSLAATKSRDNRTAMNTYAHVLPTMHRDAADRMDELLAGCSTA